MTLKQGCPHGFKKLFETHAYSPIEYELLVDL